MAGEQLLSEFKNKDSLWLKNIFSEMELREISESAALQEEYFRLLELSQMNKLRTVKILLYRFLELRTCLICASSDDFEAMFGASKHDYAFEAYNLSADLVNKYLEAKRLL